MYEHAVHAVHARPTRLCLIVRRGGHCAQAVGTSAVRLAARAYADAHAVDLRAPARAASHIALQVSRSHILYRSNCILANKLSLRYRYDRIIFVKENLLPLRFDSIKILSDLVNIYIYFTILISKCLFHMSMWYR